MVGTHHSTQPSDKVVGGAVGKRGVSDKNKKKLEQKEILRASMGDLVLRVSHGYRKEMVSYTFGRKFFPQISPI